MSRPDASALLDRIVRIAESDERIRAVLAFGSHASGTADEFSDVDVGLVLADDDGADVVAVRNEVAAQLGRTLLAMDFGDPSNVHLIFDDGVAAELILVREAELDHSRPYRVLLDKDGLVARAAARSPAERGTPDERAVEELLLVFWHDLEHVIAALGRGHLLWAHGGLEEMRGICILLARLAAGADFEPDDPYWKVDGALRPEHAAALRPTVVPAEPGPMLVAARQLVALYRELAAVVATAREVAYPQELDALLSPRLDELRTG